jgi:hypothetical protein
VFAGSNHQLQVVTAYGLLEVEAKMDSGKLTYRNEAMQWGVGTSCMLVTLCFIYQAFTPGKGGVGLVVISAISAAATASMTARALIAPSIAATPDGVRVRTLVRTRKYAWTEIERFQAKEERVGIAARRHRILGIALRNGETIWFSGLADRPDGCGYMNRAILTLNQYSEVSARL